MAEDARSSVDGIIKSYQTRRGDLRSPEISLTAAHPSVAAKERGTRLSLLQREKVPRNEADEVLVT